MCTDLVHIPGRELSYVSQLQDVLNKIIKESSNYKFHDKAKSIPAHYLFHPSNMRAIDSSTTRPRKHAHTQAIPKILEISIFKHITNIRHTSKRSTIYPSSRDSIDNDGARERTQHDNRAKLRTKRRNEI